MDRLRCYAAWSDGACERYGRAKGLCGVHRRQQLSNRGFSEVRKRKSNGRALERDNAGRKQCTSCSGWFSPEEFNRNGGTADGLTCWCKSCVVAEHRVRRYGLSHNDAKELLAAQDHECRICQEELTLRAIYVDHDHACCPTSPTCGRCVRGLLCRTCNFMLGFAKDDTTILASAITYLEEWHESRND